MNKKLEGHPISKVDPGSIGEELELEPGDRVLTINGNPVEDIFEIGKPRMNMPEPALSLKSVKCSVCGESAAETKMRVMDGLPVCMDCYSGYDRGWD